MLQSLLLQPFRLIPLTDGSRHPPSVSLLVQRLVKQQAGCVLSPVTYVLLCKKIDRSIGDSLGKGYAACNLNTLSKTGYPEY